MAMSQRHEPMLQTAGTKRPHPHPGSPLSEQHPPRRQKRDKYTTVACNECKKRKIKCNGEATCMRCSTIGIACVYNAVDSSSNTCLRLNDLDSKYRSLQQQVTALQTQLQNALGKSSKVDGFAVSNERSTGQSPNSIRALNKAAEPRVKSRSTQEAPFAGPSSIKFGLDLGKSSLKRIGVQLDEGIESTVPNSAYNSQPGSPVLPAQADNKDPLDSVSCEEALRLIKYYEEELYPIYPMLNASHTILVAKCRLKRASGHEDNPKAVEYDERDVDVLRMVVATSLILEGGGAHPLADGLVGEVQNNMSGRSWIGPADLNDVLIYAMMSIYFFSAHEEVMAWRTIGNAVRLALELGMHRHKTLLRMFPDPDARKWAIKLFWSIYVLDQRWSLGSGLPCALNSADIDPDLPEPTDQSPYSVCLLSYARLSSKVQRYVDTSASLSIRERKEEADYLDFQLVQWQRTISPELQLIHPNTGSIADQQPRNLQRLRVLLYARCNHLRIVNRRHYLLSATAITENMEDARFVVETAKDTIQVLAHLNRTSDIYQKQQSLFNYFLISAVAALFLAVCHGPTTFSELCRSEFMTALELVRGFSSKSLVSRRLWKTVRDLRQLAPKLGLTPEASTNTMDMKLSDDMPDAGAGVQEWDLDAVWGQHDALDWMGIDGTPDMTAQMSYALTDLFDVMGATATRYEPGPSSSKVDGGTDLNGFTL